MATLLALAHTEPFTEPFGDSRRPNGKTPPEWIAALDRHQFSIRPFVEEDGLGESQRETARLILIRADGRDGRIPDLLRRLRRSPDVPVILIQSAESPDLAAVARAYGVSDYLREPISADDLVSSVRKCLGESRLPRPRITRATLSGGERMVGNSPVMAELRRRIASIAAADCNVLITGETGTGKELAAELIHTNGRRSQGRFVCVNCAAIPEMLLESELFGYEKGAFTGAHSTRLGQVELADGGILFLDEIGELSLHAQAKILRVIEGKEVARLGRRMGVRVDVRMVCATNRDLEAEVRKGTFRADLFFRLNVARLELPPLRERKADLRDLATHYLREFSAAMGLEVAGFTGDSWQCLLRHEWPGNVRELKNAVEASLVHLPYPRMRLAELPDELCRQFTPAHPEPSESDRLLNALAAHNWNKSKAAQDLRWSRMTLYRKMAKHQLSSSTRTQVRTA